MRPHSSGAALCRQMADWLFAGLLLLCPWMAVAQSAVPVALVTDRVGNVSVTAPGAPHGVATLSAMPSGTRVQLDAAASLKLMYVASGDEYTVTGPGSAEVGASSVEAQDGAAVRRRAADAAKPLRLRADAVTMGGIVMRGGRLRPRYPAGVVTLPPTRIAWEALAADAPYRIELRDAAGAVLLDARIQGLTVALPASVELKPGMRYTWTVSPDAGAAAPPGNTNASASFDFAPSELRDEAARLKPAADAPLADRVVYALWLEQAGAVGEARQLWQALAEERPDDDALQARSHR